MPEARQALPLQRWLFSFGVGAVVVVVLRLWRGFFWTHALIVGMAISALVYSAWRTWENVRQGSPKS